MELTPAALRDAVLARDMRVIARLITMQENRAASVREVMAELYGHTGKARVLGVTGSPGSGKSTLVDRLVVQLRASGQSVAVVAVDPTSPFSGGAVLGDRIRMAEAAEDKDVFVRSMATRGALGGLSRATLDAINILDAAGFDTIVVETVGVGQQEVDIMRCADTCLVVLVPGMGDSVQAIKAGVLEIADVFVINKADRPGVDRLHRDLRVMQGLGETSEGEWAAEIVRTVATEGEGVAEVVEAAEKHYQWLSNSPGGLQRKVATVSSVVTRMVQDIAVERSVDDQAKPFDAVVKECSSKELDPYSAALKLLQSATWNLS